MKDLVDFMTAIGLPPAMAGLALVLAILLRYARGMFKHINSEWTYALAVAFGSLGGVLESNGDPKSFIRIALALTATTLIGQRVLQSAAKVVPWIPADDQWTS